jgi:hypothetical protein
VVVCGLVSVNPHAVRALERAAQKLCLPQVIEKHAQLIVNASGIPYVKEVEALAGMLTKAN